MFNTAEAEAKRMTPTLLECMASFMRSKTHLSYVPLEANLANGKYAYPKDQNQRVVQVAQQLTSDPKVQCVLSQRLTYLPDEITQRNQTLEQHQFQLLSTKPFIPKSGPVEIRPYYNVVKHPDLKGWIIKTGAMRIPEDYLIQTLTTGNGETAHFNDYESLLRFELADRIRASIERHGFDALVANEYAVRFTGVDDAIDLSEQYFIISEELDLLPVEEMVSYLKTRSETEQRTFAQMVITIIRESGLSDASFDNIRMTRDHRVAFIDTEPGGLFVKEGDEKAIGGSLEKHSRIGLVVFGTVAEQNGLPIIHEEAQQALQAQLANSTTRLALLSIAMALPAGLIITGYCPRFISNRGLVVKVIIAGAGTQIPNTVFGILAARKIRDIHQKALTLVIINSMSYKDDIERARACYHAAIAYRRAIEDIPMNPRVLTNS